MPLIAYLIAALRRVVHRVFLCVSIFLLHKFAHRTTVQTLSPVLQYTVIHVQQVVLCFILLLYVKSGLFILELDLKIVKPKELWG